MVIKLYVYIPVPMQIGGMPGKDTNVRWHLAPSHTSQFSKALFHYLSKRNSACSARWN